MTQKIDQIFEKLEDLHNWPFFDIFDIYDKAKMQKMSWVNLESYDAIITRK